MNDFNIVIIRTYIGTVCVTPQTDDEYRSVWDEEEPLHQYQEVRVPAWDYISEHYVGRVVAYKPIRPALGPVDPDEFTEAREISRVVRRESNASMWAHDSRYKLWGVYRNGGRKPRNKRRERDAEPDAALYARIIWACA